MKYTNPLKVLALMLAAVCAPAVVAAEGSTVPSPAVMRDTAPLPPQERGSIGAVIMSDSPVLAQREAYQYASLRYEGLLREDARKFAERLVEMAGRPDTRVMGNRPAPK